ncbi:hypothetical protein [Desulfovibrio ferrophilus]|uniref:DUF1146 domain-containing protein n=1 Tax=Desulfovibrio ferrophilus TaxID=241368 RepID=A0A2Z6AZJ5_9BACT|nr:hypothetical protein [Desulfovibrio ferrophilus]BBD08613.1 putative uncharacterized protein [Desulfovibrio ferrophilus]
MAIIYALGIFIVVFLAWHFYIHKVLKDMVFSRMTQQPIIVTVLSMVSFIAALLIVWTISGISVLQYLTAVMNQTGP